MLERCIECQKAIHVAYLTASADSSWILASEKSETNTYYRRCDHGRAGLRATVRAAGGAARDRPVQQLGPVHETV